VEVQSAQRSVVPQCVRQRQRRLSLELPVHSQVELLQRRVLCEQWRQVDDALVREVVHLSSSTVSARAREREARRQWYLEIDQLALGFRSQ